MLINMMIRYKKSEKKSLGAFKAVILWHRLLFFHFYRSFRRLWFIFNLFLLDPFNLWRTCVTMFDTTFLVLLVRIHCTRVLVLLATTSTNKFLLSLFLLLSYSQ
jgi:hypothetical protein